MPAGRLAPRSTHGRVERALEEQRELHVVDECVDASAHAHAAGVLARPSRPVDELVAVDAHGQVATRSALRSASAS